MKIQSLTAKNFLSVGNVTQSINFLNDQLTLVLGEDLDSGGDNSGKRNGTGKSTILSALSYAFFGQAITNIKKDNLINKVNGKSMLVTVRFEKNGINYRIERGRKPNILKFYINDNEQEISDIDESQGDSRKTQEDINALIEMNHLMFKHIIALNTYTDPFLNLKASDQREFIEHLLGITLLSKKSDLLKEQIKLSKDIINQETIKIETIKASNEKVKTTIDNLKAKQRSWIATKNSDIKNIKKAIENSQSIDVDEEIKNHEQLKLFNDLTKVLKSLEKELSTLKMMRDQSKRVIDKETSNLKSLIDHKCHACGQELHDSNQQQMIESIEKEISKHKTQYTETLGKISELESDIKIIKSEMFDKPETFYATIDEAQKHKNNLYELTVHLKQKESESDPYDSQIDDLQSTAIQEVDWTVINTQVSLKEHQEFLLKLLTNKDSFIRKKIIDQNLNYINQRLSYYLELIESPHKVVFQSDLQVEITHFGNDLDFDNLSRGEKNRVILSLSWAFRDLWENLYQPVNLLFIDELIDNGLDSAGVESCIEILKMMARERNKNIYLISHRDELVNRVDNLLKVTKENGFTSYNISETS